MIYMGHGAEEISTSHIGRSIRSRQYLLLKRSGGSSLSFG